MHLLGAIHTDGDADAVRRQKLNDGGCQQRGVGGQAEIDMPSVIGCLLAGVCHHLLEQRKVHQRLAAEEGHVNRTAAGRLLQQKIHGGLRGLEIHEFRLALGRCYFIGAELVTVLTRQVALVGEIQHQGLQREISGRGLDRFRNVSTGNDDVGVHHFRHELFRVIRFQTTGDQIFDQLIVG